MDGNPALTLSDLVIEVFHSVPKSFGKNRCRPLSQTCITLSQSSTPTLFKQTLTTFHPTQYILVLVPCCMSLEDNEAVIKMIIRGRSPTMRHVSRTHRVAPGCLCDRINLDPKIHIRYIDTKHQFADMLTKGNLWNNLLHVFNISAISAPLAAPRISA